MRSDERRPVNVGNPKERTVQEIAELVIELSGSESSIVYEPLPEDDPKRRCPEIGRAREALGCVPRVGAREGLSRGRGGGRVLARKAAIAGGGHRAPGAVHGRYA